jgi:dynein heavy chain
MTYTTF